MTPTKTIARQNREVVRGYWHSYLNDGHLMAWLTADENGALEAIYEPEGSRYYIGDNEVLHKFGDFRRAHGDLPKRITLKAFVAELDVAKYMTA